MQKTALFLGLILASHAAYAGAPSQHSPAIPAGAKAHNIQSDPSLVKSCWLLSYWYTGTPRGPLAGEGSTEIVSYHGRPTIGEVVKVANSASKSKRYPHAAGAAVALSKVTCDHKAPGRP